MLQWSCELVHFEMLCNAQICNLDVSSQYFMTFGGLEIQTVM